MRMTGGDEGMHRPGYGKFKPCAGCKSKGACAKAGKCKGKGKKK